METFFLGETTFKYFPKSDAIDSDPDNDTLYSEIDINYELISRSYGDENGIILTNIDSLGIFQEVGNVFPVFANFFALGEVLVPIVDTSYNIDQTIYAIVYKLNTETGEWEDFDRSFDYVITEEHLGETVTLFLNEFWVGEGDVFLITLKSYEKFIFQTAQIAENNSVFGGNTFDADMVLFEEIPRVIDMDIHAYFGAIDELPTTQLNLKQNYPNPFNEATTINYTLENSEDLSYVITDINGKLIEQVKLGAKLAGEHSLQLNTENWETGNYLFTLFTSKGKQSITLTKAR